MSDDGQYEDRQPYSEKDYTLIFCRRVNSENGRREILLGMKKRGFGQGKWNGFGGKLEENEDILSCARRELLEECGVTCQELRRAGYLVFKMLEVQKIMRVHVFDTWEFSGEPVESDEMRPQWYYEDEVPFSKMWVDDKYWFSFLLEKKPFLGR
jgi:8-oxo-dGTP diphosphatase/2-hydroxy-dATP diphosphatase